jgi:hypothetical protein
MFRGRLLALFLSAATIALIAVGTLYPVDSARPNLGGRVSLLPTSASAEAAAGNLLREIGQRNFGLAYSNLANRNEFSESDFVRDLTGSYPSLRTYAALDSFDLHPVRVSSDQAQIHAVLHWSTVVGTFQEVRDLQLVRGADRWQVEWPVVKEPRLAPQVIPVNYLRWDVIYRGPEDDWGVTDVEAPHVRIVDMHPIDRGGNVIVMGEILNEDVIPAFVTVKATLLSKDGSAIVTEDAFDNISHLLLPKQVSPFRIDFSDVGLSQVDSIRMSPSSTLIAASADPVVESEDQKLSSLPDPSLKAKLVNQSGQVVNIARVLATFYDANGQLVWVSGEYVDRALIPQTAVAVSIPLPSDLAAKVKNYRLITSPYSSTRLQ